MSVAKLFLCKLLRRGMRPAALLLAMAPAGLALHAQATTPTASRLADLQVGAGVSGGKSSGWGQFDNPYASVKLLGFGLYATYDFRPHLGLEFDFHQINSGNGQHVYQRSYEWGPRYVLHLKRFNPYARVMYGRGVLNYPDNIANLAYNMVVGGAGVDVNVQKHINVRADYEYQHWFSVPTVGSLTPQVGTLGVAYHF